MGGGSMPEQGGGKRKRKSLDAVINVVPAIDLLSCCITFLLYTAVWTQISRLQVSQFGAGAPETAAQTEQQKQLVVTLAVGDRGMYLSTSAGMEVEIPLRPGDKKQDLQALADKVKVIRSEHPEAAAVTVSAQDAIPYGDLVSVIDTCVGEGLVSVLVTGV